MQISRRSLIVGATVAGITRPARAWPHGSPSSSPFTINWIPDSSWSSAPQYFIDGLATATNMYKAIIHDNVTLNIRIGYNERSDSSGSIVTPNLGTGAETNNENSLMPGANYIDIRAALLAKQSSCSATFQAYVATLPAGTILNGVTNYTLLNCAAKTLNMVDPHNVAIDAEIGMGQLIPADHFVGVMLHEIGHAMGRDTATTVIAPFCYGKYTAPGTRTYLRNVAGTYLSIDDGVTNLATYVTSGADAGSSYDNATGNQGSADPYNALYIGTITQSLTAVDKAQLIAQGWNMS